MQKDGSSLGNLVSGLIKGRISVYNYIDNKKSVNYSKADVNKILLEQVLKG
jgi:hypothetical protein